VAAVTAAHGGRLDPDLRLGAAPGLGTARRHTAHRHPAAGLSPRGSYSASPAGASQRTSPSRTRKTLTGDGPLTSLGCRVRPMPTCPSWPPNAAVRQTPSVCRRTRTGGSAPTGRPGSKRSLVGRVLRRGGGRWPSG
jgi:hypothetical protein